MTSVAYTVPLSRVIAEGVRIELAEAVAVLDAIWAAVAGTSDADGRYDALPTAECCVLTAFGDLEIQMARVPAAAAQRAPEAATGLCRLLWKMVTSGRANARGLPPEVVEVLRAVEGQRRVGGEVTFETPEALLEAWTGARIADGSAALAHLYARWAVAAATPQANPPRLGRTQPLDVPTPAVPAVAAMAGGVDLPLYTPSVLDPGNATSRFGPLSGAANGSRRPRQSHSTRVGAAVVTAATVAVLAVGVARVQRTAGADLPANTGTGPVATAAPAVAVTTPKPVPRLVSQAPIVDAESRPAATAVGSGTALPETAPGGEALTRVSPTAPRRLVRAADVGATPYSPSFASSNGALVFHAGQANTGLHEASLRSDGTVEQVRTLVRDGASSYHVQMSPNGKQMAFDSDRDGVRGVYVANRDGSGARRVSGGGMALVPSWSPDGSRLAFVRAEPARPRVWQLWTVVLSTNQLQQHTYHHVGQPWGGSWFPDGQRLAYSLEDRLMVLDIRSGERRTYRSPLPGRLVRTPAVSPAGDRIAFQVRQDGMWMLDLASGQKTRILADRSAQEFAWSPDGRLVAYHSARGGTWEIWAVPVSGP